MIHLKKDSEIKIMQEGGKILDSVLKVLLDNVKPGINLNTLDKIAENEINTRGAKPSFHLVPGYHWSICACVNDVVVHGIPSDYVISEGDAVGIDCGVYYKGFHTDAAWTVKVGSKQSAVSSKEDEVDKFLKTGVKALQLAINQVKIGNFIYDISLAIQSTIEEGGFSIVRSLVGHGVGRSLHEEPEIPGFVPPQRDPANSAVIKLERIQTPEIKPGMALAIEVIYNMGNSAVTKPGSDGWTIKTKDGKISGLFEATVAVTSHGCIVLSPYSWYKIDRQLQH